MNRTHVARIAWKDYRRLQGFWWALVAFWIVGLFYVSYLALVWRTPERFMPAHMLSGVLITALMYGLGCGGLSFAMEHEEQTYGLLRGFPLGAASLYWGKFAHTLVSAIALIVVLTFLCLLHATLMDRWIPYDWSSLGLTQNLLWLLLVPLACCLGMYWSMKVRRPFIAIALAAASVTIAVAAIAAAARAFRLDREAFELAASPCLVLATAVLVLTNRRTAHRWLPQSAPTDQVVDHATETVPQTGDLTRLLWVFWKQSGYTTLGLGIAGVLVALAPVAGLGTPGPLYGIPFTVLALLGVSVFRPEQQQRRYRLLGQLGVPAAAYWLSRILIPGITAIIISWIVAWGAMLSLQQMNASVVFSYVFFASLAAFSLGQLGSLAFRSAILAIAFSLFATLAICTWTLVSMEWYLPLLTGPVAATVLPLTSTYLRVPTLVSRFGQLETVGRTGPTTGSHAGRHPGSRGIVPRLRDPSSNFRICRRIECLRLAQGTSAARVARARRRGPTASCLAQ